MNILGITGSSTLTFHHHISALVTESARSLYDLMTIRAVGRYTCYTGLTCMLALPAWWEYLKADEKNLLQFVIKKAIRYGYLPRSFSTMSELSEDSDEKLFRLAKYNPNHVLHRFLPQPKTVQYNLRKRTHDLTLPTDVNAVIKQNFVYRMLFSDLY